MNYDLSNWLTLEILAFVDIDDNSDYDPECVVNLFSGLVTYGDFELELDCCFDWRQTMVVLQRNKEAMEMRRILEEGGLWNHPLNPFGSRDL